MDIKRALAILILLLVIILSFGFATFTIFARGSDDNYFNRNLRPKFASFPFLRQALGLHFDGDGKADYLSERYGKILIEVDIMDPLETRAGALKLLTDQIAQTTGKQVSYLISDQNIPRLEALDRDKLEELVREHRNHKNTRGIAGLYLLYATELENEPDRLGSTFEEYGIVLYGEALERFTKNSPATLSNYEVSTALHEFGHQIGLPHNTQPGCLMNEHAEEAHVAAQEPEDVIIDFCEFEKNQIVNYGQ